MVPVTVRVVLGAPAAIVLGLRVVITGAATVRLEADEVAESLGFCTVTLNVPALDSRLLGRVAVMEVAVAAVTVSGADRLVPPGLAVVAPERPH